MTREKIMVGDSISWGTFGGNKYEGKVIDKEDDCLHVLCTDGVIRAVDYQGE